MAAIVSVKNAVKNYTLGKVVVVSSAFARAYDGKLASLGRHELKDVEGSQELFTLP